MSLLTTTCPECGEIDVPIDDVVLRVRDRVGGGTCVLRCPGCEGRIERAADRSMTVLLLAVGVSVSMWPVEGSSGGATLGPITHDELLAFAERLRDDVEIEAGLGAI